MSPTRAAGMLLISTVAEPFATIPGPPGTHPGSMHGAVVSVALAAGAPPTSTVGAPMMIVKGSAGCGRGVGTGAGGWIGAWQWGAACKTMSPSRAAGIPISSPPESRWLWPGHSHAHADPTFLRRSHLNSEHSTKDCWLQGRQHSVFLSYGLRRRRFVQPFLGYEEDGCENSIDSIDITSTSSSPLRTKQRRPTPTIASPSFPSHSVRRPRRVASSLPSSVP